MTERSTGTESVDSDPSLTGLEQVASLFSFSKSALRSARTPSGFRGTSLRRRAQSPQHGNGGTGRYAWLVVLPNMCP